MCAAIVQLYHIYYLYYLVLRVSSDFCAVYLYYFDAPTQILRALAAPTQLVPATASHRPPPLNSQWWRSRSGPNGGSPVLATANVVPSMPPPSHQCPVQSIRPIQPVANQPAHKSQFLLANPILMPIQSRPYDPANTIQTIRSSQYDPANTIQPASPLKGTPQQNQD